MSSGGESALAAAPAAAEALPLIEPFFANLSQQLVAFEERVLQKLQLVDDRILVLDGRVDELSRLVHSRTPRGHRAGAKGAGKHKPDVVDLALDRVDDSWRAGARMPEPPSPR